MITPDVRKDILYRFKKLHQSVEVIAEELGLAVSAITKVAYCKE